MTNDVNNGFPHKVLSRWIALGDVLCFHKIELKRMLNLFNVREFHVRQSQMENLLCDIKSNSGFSSNFFSFSPFHRKSDLGNFESSRNCHILVPAYSGLSTTPNSGGERSPKPVNSHSNTFKKPSDLAAKWILTHILNFFFRFRTLELFSSPPHHLGALFRVYLCSNSFVRAFLIYRHFTCFLQRL